MYSKERKMFDEVISWSQDLNIELLNTKGLFDKWYEAKKRFIDAFGGLVYEVPKKVSVNLSADAQGEKIEYFLRDIRYDYGVEATERLRKFISANKEGFFDNRVVEPCGYEKVNKGMRLLKAIKTIPSTLTDETLTDIQNKASMVIQQGKVSGILCLSVHPLDFISSSETTYNWRSCHALDGEYRTGNLSYMVDKCTFMAYLKSESGETNVLPNFPNSVPWNSKKWRMLIEVDEDQKVFICSRQYPFESVDFLTTIRETLCDAFKLERYKYEAFHNNYVTKVERKDGKISHLDKKYMIIGERLSTLTNVVKDHPDNRGYNDILHSSYYENPYYMSIDYTTKMPKIEVGGQVHCLICGEKLVCNSESMLCVDCELEYGHLDNDMFDICEHCGRRVLSEDTVYVEGMGRVCQDCYDELELIECDECGQMIFADDAISVEIDGVERHYCGYCWKYEIEPFLDDPNAPSLSERLSDLIAKCAEYNDTLHSANLSNLIIAFKNLQREVEENGVS